MAALFKALQKPWVRALGLGLLAFLLLTPLGFLKLGQTLENLGLDVFYRWRAASPPPPELLIVGIDESSFQELRHSWPWPRRLHAALIDRLAAAGARLIVFDVIFSEPSTPEDDESLAAAIRRAGNVILTQTWELTRDRLFSRHILVQPLASLREAALDLGLTVVSPDADGVVRRFRLQLVDSQTLPAASIRHFRPQLDLPPALSGLIHYAGPPRSLDTVSYYQVLDEMHPLPEARIRGRIVLIGRMPAASVSPQALADDFYTPFFAGSGQFMSGVEIQGQIIHTLLTGSWGREMPPAWRFAVLFAILLLFGFLVAPLPPLAGLGALAGLILATWGCSLYLFLHQDFWFPPVLLSGGLAFIYTGNVVAHYLLEAREKRWLRQAFGRYVSPALVEAITAHPEQLRLGGEMVEVTVLFTDLAGFTGLSETMGPEDLIRLLNEYFSAMTRIILENQGTLDKYIGDAIMAFWGAPLPLQDHAARACKAALEMQAAMTAWREDPQAQSLSGLASRVGIHTGRVIAGNVGSLDRFDYTVIGDTVNLASRLEGLNKFYGTGIIASGSTRQHLADLFLWRELDQVRVKGRVQPVTVYELLGPAAPEGPPVWLGCFEAGRAAYLERRFGEAEGRFQEALNLRPQDPPARFYLERCRAFLQQPPPPDWGGVFTLESK